MSEFARMLRESKEKQSNALSDIFSEEPVPLEVFVEDKKFLDNPSLSPVQYEAVRHIERIYYPSLYPQMAEAFDGQRWKIDNSLNGRYTTEPLYYWGQPTRMINFAVLQWGKGSGKDHVCRIASMRIAYLLICLKSPQRYFEFPAPDTIHLLNVAASSYQAQQAFFIPITRAVKSGWFKDNCYPKPGIGLISWNKNVEAISGHADAESQEGLNLILGIADEIDAFRSKDEFSHRVRQLREPTKSAEGILQMIEGSSASRFPETFKNVVISYPRYQGSIIQRLTENARTDNEELGEDSKYYVSGPLTTWDVNPRYNRYERIEVPGAGEPVPNVVSIVKKYQKEPEVARAIYECKPSTAINPYFRNEMAIEDCMVEMEQQPIEVSYRKVHSHASLDGWVWEPIYKFADDFHAVKGAIYAMHGDLSVSSDYAGIAMAHVVSRDVYEDTTVTEDGEKVPVIEYRPVVKVDFVFPFRADLTQDPPREIQIRWAAQLAFELRKRGFNIKLMTFDGYESKDSMQRLEQKGIESKKVSTDASESPWRNLRDLLYEGRVSMPLVPLLREELLRLTKLPNGKIDHPANGSKDLADAVACAVLGAVEVGGTESPDGEHAYYEPASFEFGSLFDVPEGMDPGLSGMPIGLDVYKDINRYYH